MLNCIEFLMDNIFLFEALFMTARPQMYQPFLKYYLSMRKTLKIYLLKIGQEKGIYFTIWSISSKTLGANCGIKKALFFHHFILVDDIHATLGEVFWKLLYDKDHELEENLEKARKITKNVLHPGKLTQNVSIILHVFHDTTTVAIRSYFPVEMMLQISK